MDCQFSIARKGIFKALLLLSIETFAREKPCPVVFEAVGKALAKSSTYTGEVLGSGGLRLAFSPESPGVFKGREILGGLFSEVENSKSLREGLAKAIKGDFDGHFSQAPIRGITKLFTGRPLEFTPSRFIANRTRIAPGSHFEEGLRDGRPGWTLSPIVSGISSASVNTVLYGFPILAGVRFASYKLIVEPERKKLESRIRKNPKSYQDYILYNYDADEILHAIRIREGLTDPKLSHAEIDQKLRSKITIEDMLIAHGKQKSVLASFMLLNQYSTQGLVPVDEIKKILINLKPSDSLFPALAELESERKNLLQKSSDEEISALFHNRLARSVSGYIAGVAMEENWPTIDVAEIKTPLDTSQNETLKQSRGQGLVEVKAFEIANFYPLEILKEIGDGKFNTEDYKISADFKDPVVINYYFQKLLALRTDLELFKIQGKLSGDVDKNFKENFSKIIDEDIFVRYNLKN